MKLPESSFILLQLAGPFQNLSLVQLFVKLYTRKYSCWMLLWSRSQDLVNKGIF